MKKVMTCELEKTVSTIGGKWKLIILWHLEQKTLRFSEIEKQIPGINQKMLSQSLKELEKEALVRRTVYSVIPPKVEYSITKHGKSLGIVLKSLDNWGEKHRSFLRKRSV